MVLKDVNVRENLNMDNHRNTTAPLGTTSTPTFTSKRRFTLSFTSLLLVCAFFLCTLLAASFLIYNFAHCDQLTPLPGEDVICTTIRQKHPPKSNESDTPKYETDIRLPHAIKPIKYNITLVPYLTEDNFSFEGQVAIRITIMEECYNITMHAIQLNISKSDVSVRSVKTFLQDGKNDSKKTIAVGTELRVRKQYFVESKQFFIIELYDKLTQGHEYEVNIKYTGLIQDYLQGFYRSSYQIGNQTRWLAFTQFQATDARRAFPCFDEPALKAKFTLNIARPINMTTISNMPIIVTKKHETLAGYVWDYFAESLPMSTYLVAYAISDFGHLSKGNFSVWARTDALQSAQYALSVGPKILKFLEEYFQIDFPLPKMDMIALPDFQAGAMENWGLITYRETTMLFEEGVSATTNKQRIASVIGHELAHQWFGNLVTPSWWTDIWLNEGFASYMEYITVDAIQPDWKTHEQFVVNELQNVFQLDALSTSHKISTDVSNPDEVSEIFDRISYGKGCTIIRMMSHFLTSKVFRLGLNRYLKDMSYNSAEQDDLWRFLTIEAVKSGLLDGSTTVKEIMDTWTLQKGYPVVNISTNPNTHIIRLEQEHFKFEKDNDTNYKPLWWIPITYTTSKELNFENTRPITWIPHKKVYEIENQNLSTAEWFIFNIQQTGYYRVLYETSNWKAIINHLMKPDHFKEIVPANRAQLIDDAFNLARGGYLNYEIALNMTRYLAHEDQHVPWKAAITAFNFMDSMFVNQGDYDLFKNYILRLLTSVYNGVGFEDDPNDKDNMLKLFKRAEILNMACHLGQRDCIAESTRHFQNWIQSPNPDTNNPISPNLRNIVYCSAIQYGTEAEWDFAFERLLKTTVSAEKELLLTALGCSKEPWILFRYLRRSLSGEYVRKQDVFRVFAAVSGNVIGQQIAFDFLRSNWEEIKSYLGASMANLNLIVKFATKRMNSKFMLSELETFVHNELNANGRSIKQVIEQVQNNIKWMKTNYKSIAEWLKREAKEHKNKTH